MANLPSDVPSMTTVLRHLSAASGLVVLLALGCSGASADKPGSFALDPVVASVPQDGATAPAQGSTEPPIGEPSLLRIMSLNIYGWATMPRAAPEYAALVETHNVDVVGIQEGNWDWEIEGWPTDYSRSEQLHAALGECWQRQYQIFVNTCRGAALDSHRRFDLTDGPRAVRTGETALVTKSGTQVAFLNVHWDHESAPARAASAIETAAEANLYHSLPTLVLGDFNSDCTSADVRTLRRRAEMELVVDAGIDCILARGISGSGISFSAPPSDHPAVVATFTIGD